MSTREHSRTWRRKLRVRAFQLIGTACIWCGSEEDVEAAHVSPTKLKGPGRGLDRRYKDVIRNPECYRPMCREHHRLFDKLVKDRIAAVEAPVVEKPIPF